MFVPMKQVDVLCIGYACWDLNFKVKTFPGPDEKVVTDTLISEGGGPAANAAFAINRLGGTATLACRLSRDNWGKAHLKELQSAGVDTSCVLVTDAPTSLSSVIVTENGRRSLVNYRPEVKPGDFNFEGLTPGCILIDGHEPKGADLALHRFKNIPSILDAGSLRPATKELLGKVSYVVASASFACELSGSDKPADWIACLVQFQRNIAITDGGRGLYTLDGDRNIFHIPAIPVEAVDTTGAGDIFHGACALSLARGENFEHALRWANKVAAISVTKPGGRSSCPTKEEVDRLAIRND